MEVAIVRVLVVGGAGNIGSHTELKRFDAAGL
jgi:hypothetical protein